MDVGLRGGLLLVALLIPLVSAEAQVQSRESVTDKQGQPSDRREIQAGDPETILYLYRIALARREWEANNAARVREILDSCPKHLRHWEWRYLRSLCHSALFTRPGPTRGVAGVVFSPDGTRLAASGGRSETVVLDAGTGDTILTLAKGGGSVDFSPDGDRIAVSDFNTVTIYDAGTGEKLNEIAAHDIMIQQVSFHPDGSRVVSCSGVSSGGGRTGGGQIRVWDIGSGENVLSIEDTDTRWVNSAEFSPSGKYIASASGQLSVVGPPRPSSIKIWDASTGEIVRSMAGHGFHCTRVVFSPDGKRLVSASADKTVRVWEVESGRELATLDGHTRWVRAAIFSPDGKRIVSAGDDRMVHIWDATNGRLIRSIRGITEPVLGVDLSPDGRRLATTSGARRRSGVVSVWDAQSAQEALTFSGGDSADISSDGRLLASSSSGYGSLSPGRAVVREISTGKELFSVGARHMGFGCVRFSPDGKRVAIGGHEMAIYDVESGEKLRSFQARMKPDGGNLAFSPDGDRIAVASGRSTMIYDVASGQKLNELSGYVLRVISVAFSPDGQLLVAMNMAGYLSGRRGKVPSEVKVWNLDSGEERSSFTCEGVRLAFSPDSRRVAVAKLDGTVTLRDVDDAREVLALVGHSDAVSCVAFSPDGRRLLTGSQDQSIKLWDLTSGLETFSLRGHTSGLSDVRFGRDGEVIVAASEDGTIRVWDAPRVATTGR